MVDDTIQEIDPQLTQVNYEETPYEDSSWEVVGDEVFGDEFQPMQMDVVSRAQHVTDPMFHDYGGIPKVKTSRRWHLPEELSYQTPEHLRKLEEVEEEDPHVKITEDEIEAIRQEAYQKGLEEGRAAATEELGERMQTIEAKVTSVFEDLKTQFEEQLVSCEKRSVSLALGISEKLVGHAVEINPEYIVGIVKQGIDLAGSSTIRRVRVSPEDLEFIELVGLTAQLRSHDDIWEFVADDTIQAGCVFETSAGELDFNLNDAWKRIEAKVMKVIR